MGSAVTRGRAATSTAIILIVTALAMPAGAGTETVKLVPPDGGANHGFGQSVAISDGLALMGASGSSDHGRASGAAYLYSEAGGDWVQAAKLTASDAAEFKAFGLSVAIEGERAIVTDAGNAYVFESDGQTWVEVAEFTASDYEHGDGFGHSLAMSGDTVVLGSVGDDDAGDGAGAAYVFALAGGTWVEEAKLIASDAGSGDWFGVSVAIEGDSVVVGAQGRDDGGVESGAAYVFTRTPGGWVEEAKLVAADAAAGDWLGASVAVSGDFAVAGAFADDDAGMSSGAAYVFARTPGGWLEEAKLTSQDAQAGDQFGYAVAAEGETVVVGASNDGAFGTEAGGGAAFVFTRSGGAWPQELELAASDGAGGDSFGSAVATHDGVVLVGAERDRPHGINSGSAYVFDVTELDSPRQRLAAVRDDIYFFPESGDFSVDGPLDRAVGRLNRAVEDAVWTDNWRPDPESGRLVYDRAAIAVRQLEHVSLFPDFEADAAGWLGEIVEALRLPAEVAVDDALASGGDPIAIAEAQARLSRGDELAETDSAAALLYYRVAWTIAVGALPGEG